MKIDILTLFPEMFCGPFDYSIVKRAQEKKLLEIDVHDLKKWAIDQRGTVDDRPYGGGVGMVMMVEPIYKALNELLNLGVRNEKNESHFNLQSPASHLPHLTSSRIILLSPRGKTFNQQKAQELSNLEHLILICGHYEGVDERVSDHLVNEEISLGDFVLTGGEIPAMAIVDSVVRLIPNVLEKPSAVQDESFSNFKLLEYPQYTRPENFKGWKIPEILLSGNHLKIEEWRRQKSLEKTKKERPDLIKYAGQPQQKHRKTRV